MQMFHSPSFSPSQTGQLPRSMITGIRSCIPASSGSESELEANDTANSIEIIFLKLPKPSLKPTFAGGRNLIGHCLPALAVECDVGLSRIEMADLTRNRHDLDPVQKRVGRVVAQHDGRPGFLNLAADRGIE